MSQRRVDGVVDTPVERVDQNLSHQFSIDCRGSNCGSQVSTKARSRFEGGSSRWALPARRFASNASGTPKIPGNDHHPDVYYFHYRATGPNTSSDSIAVGVGGTWVHADIGPFGTTYEWIGVPIAEVTAPGVYTADLFMHEDGARVDRVVLTTNASYDPAVEQPPASPREP